MAEEVGLLKYPTEWQGAVNCASQCFDGSSPQTPINFCAVGGGFGGGCTHNPAQMIRVCACHGYCNVHCNTVPQSTPENQKWKTVLAPYLNIAADNPWSTQVLSDCSRKLSSLDPERGLGVLHGLLVSTDDSTLLKSFLELGVDVGIPFIHSETNSYVGLSNFDGRTNFDLATAKKLNYGTAIHFAAFFGRSECVQVLVDVGASLNGETEDGKKPLDLAKDACTRMILLLNLMRMPEFIGPFACMGVGTLALLVKEEKYFAVRYKMRSGKVRTAGLNVQYDGKTALDWIWAKMTEWQLAMKMDQDSLMPFKIMAEMKYRYNVDATSLSPPPAFNVRTDTAVDKLEELVDESRKVRESQQTILESISVLSGEIKKLKTCHGGADGGR